MTTPCREQIAVAVKAVLAGITGVTGLAVERDRVSALEADDLPRLILYEAEEAGESAFTGEDGYLLSVDIEGFAGGAAEDAAASALATLRAKVDQAMLADQTLGGLIRTMSLGEEPEDSRLELASSAPAKWFTRSFVLEYATAEGDPFTFA